MGATILRLRFSLTFLSIVHTNPSNLDRVDQLKHTLHEYYISLNNEFG